MMATIKDAVELCSQLEPIANVWGFHVGVGGGTVNKTGPRKDIDIILYRRRVEINKGYLFNMAGLLEHFRVLAGLNIVKPNAFPEMWCTKCEWRGIAVDLLYPEATHDGECYGEHDDKSKNNSNLS